MIQQTFEKQTPKEGFQTAIAKYMGLADEPKTGTNKDEKTWRKVKVMFHIEGRQQPNKFIMWTPLTSDKTVYKSEQEIKQFNMYTIVWVESAQEYQGKEWVDKKIVIIKECEKESPKTVIDVQEETVGDSSPTHTSVNDDPIVPLDKFFEWYKNKYEFKDMTNYHALGIFMCANLKKGCELTLTLKTREQFQEMYDKNIDKDLGKLI